MHYTPADRHLRAVDDPEPEFSADFPALLSESAFEADAQCILVEKFRFWSRQNLALHFRLWNCPPEGAVVKCFIPFRERWRRRIPASSKLLKTWVAATGQRRVRNLTVASIRSEFVGKMFRIRIRPSGTVVRYSVVDAILRKLTE